MPPRAVVLIEPGPYNRDDLLRALDRAGYGGQMVEESPGPDSSSPGGR